MTDIICNVPINIVKVKPTSPGKIFPLAASDLIRRFSNDSIRSVALWNKGETNDVNAEQKSITESFDLFNIDTQKMTEDSDDNPDFHTWCIDRIERSLRSGAMTIGMESVLSCSSCGHPLVLAASGKAPSMCAGCNNEAPAEEKETKVLCMALPHTPKELAASVAIQNLPENWKGQLASMPPRVLLSKPRRKGVSLEGFGLNGLMLDPRVTNAAFPVYQAEKADTDAVWGIVATTHVNKVAPYYYGFKDIDAPRLGFLGISRMPIDDVLANKELVDRYGRQAVFGTMTALSLTGKNWEGPQRLQEVQTYCRRIGHKMQNEETKNEFCLTVFKQSFEPLSVDVLDAVKKIPSFILK